MRKRKMAQISDKLIDDIADYLGSRPYMEVAQLLQHLVIEVQRQKIITPSKDKDRQTKLTKDELAKKIPKEEIKTTK